MTDRSGRARRLVVLVVIAVAALIHVPFPFWGDQALFTYAAHGMRHGDRLYVDFWDYKQPGIFLWYLVSGSVFGFHEAGMHVAELIWSVAFAACTQQMLRDRVEHGWVADIAPLFTVGAFYAAARAWDLTQIEYLVAFPLMLSLWAAADAGDTPGRRRTLRLVLSGVMAAVVVYFKLVYALIPLGFWLFLLAEGRRRTPQRATARDTVRDACALLGGLIAPLLPLLAYFVGEHLLGTMWWTYVTYPPKIVRSIDPPPLSRLRDGVWFFVRNFAWLVPLAIVGFGALRRNDARRRDPLPVGLAIWFVVGWGTVLIQNQWGYQFMLPLAPLGIFAVFGVDRLSRARVRRAMPAVVVLVTVLALYPAKQVVHKVRLLVSDDFALTAAGRHRFETEFEPDYPGARAAAAFLDQPGRSPGAIHVEGNPLIQYLSGRPYALREHGWAPEQSDARLWRWTRDGLRDARPVYLFVDQFSIDIMRRNSRETLALIDSMYCRVQPVDDGAWYALRGSKECSVSR